MRHKFRIFMPLLFIFVITENYCHSQSSNEVLHLNRTTLKKFNVSEIKDYSFRKSDTQDQEDTTYTILFFDKGLITKQAIYSSEVYASVKEAEKNANDFTYSTSGKLLEINGLDGPGAHQGPFYLFKYLNTKLIIRLTGEDYWSNISSGSLIQGLTKWYYTQDNKILYSEDYDFEIDEPKNEFMDSKFNEFLRSPESVQQLPFLKKINASPYRRTYFIYENNNIAGIYPSRNLTNVVKTKADSIYSTGKLLEAKNIGFKVFSQLYFGRKDVYRKVIEDSYLKINSAKLLINNIPANKFLSNIGQKNTKYIILEPYANYFLFYKLID